MAAKYARDRVLFIYSQSNRIMFCTGLGYLHSVMSARVKIEFGNVHDANAILPQVKAGESLGHVEKKVSMLPDAS